MQHTKKRELIAAVESEIQKIAELDPAVVAKADVSTLRDSFAALVGELALGPEPETRICPKCGNRGMRAATICGYCWTKAALLPT